MLKKILMFSGVFVVLFFMFSFSVFAQTEVMPTTTNSANLKNTSAAKAADVAAKIACVGAAVAVRESALGGAVASYGEAMKAAHATRINELAGAYSNTTTKTLQVGVKVAWDDFKKSSKAATKKWRENKNAAWDTFRTAVKACKAPTGVSDSANSGSEISGQ